MSTRSNPRKNTKVLAAVSAINDLISANRAKFAAGTTLTASDFLALAKQVPDLNAPAYNANPTNIAQYNLQVVGTYTKINKLLMHRGLVIKAKNYYSSFEVVAKTDINAEVERLANRAVVCSRASGILASGATNFNSRFSKLKSPELVRVSAYFNSRA